MRQRILHVVEGLAVLALAACATAPALAPGTGLVVRDGATDAVLWQGMASYTVRAARAGAAERAVGLSSVGEVQVGVAGNARVCRFVWSREGLDRLVVYPGPEGGCGEPSSGRLCFRGVRFSAPARAPGGPSIPSSLIVTGCADENDLLWGRIDGSLPATVGPRAWRERCVRVRQARSGCRLTYLKNEGIAVATNPGAGEGFRFAWDGETWRACFLEAEAGAYQVRLLVEDSCGGSARLTLAGDSADLDD